jgi:hypothetical protein
LDLLQAQIWYSYFLYSRIFTVSIMALLPSIRKALGKVYVIVVTPVLRQGRLAPPPGVGEPFVPVNTGPGLIFG